MQSNSSDSAIEGDLLGNLSNNIIPNEDDLRNEREANEGYYQAAYHGSPHVFERFDLGASRSPFGLRGLKLFTPIVLANLSIVAAHSGCVD